MPPALLERVCPYCASHHLRFLEHGSGGTLFQCEQCLRAAVQRWEPDEESVPNTSAHARAEAQAREQAAFVFPTWFSATAEPHKPG